MIPDMNPLFVTGIESMAITGGATILSATLLTTIGRLGRPGRTLAELFTQVPLLDFWVAALTWVPWIIAGLLGGWIAMIGALAGQFVALGLWCVGHELAHREAARGPRIVKFINRTAGRWRNHLALWLTLIGLPGFWFIRILQIIAYWPLVVLLDFPKYRQSEWINVSRQKFDGLVGHDLVWCLYCDWMTGVYALGGEMLRNVESFWCPIRFYNGKKCENCRVDFPDIEHGWVPADATMREVEIVMEQKYGGPGPRAWFGHPVRMTVRGRPAQPRVEQTTGASLR